MNKQSAMQRAIKEAKMRAAVDESKEEVNEEIFNKFTPAPSKTISPEGMSQDELKRAIMELQMKRIQDQGM